MNQDIRCTQCGRKLAAGRYLELHIKCPRCRAMNHFKAERPGAPQPGATDGRQSDHSLARRQTTLG
ncbi:Com family DNA-binding transcriptional regulator [Uliginosibacterium gangwonense]|uniref:Com family DNA-binding transcriptional regulator n=1 Tax=Uliginosibacterium gangwonense TaxID=392736 RepID=UPI0009FEA67D